MFGRLCCCLAAKKKIVDEPVGTKAEPLEPKEPEAPRTQVFEAPAEGEALACGARKVPWKVEGCLPGVPEVYDASGFPDLNLESGDGHLSIFEVLGRGVSGCSVHRCQSTQIPVPSLAGKVLPLGKATFPDMVEDFGKEMEMMKSLPAHDSIVAFHGAWSTECYMDSGVQHKAYVMLLELCSSSLESVIRSRREQQQPFLAAELLHVLSQVAAGLAHLHRHRVLHRDLKSANIWLCCPEEAGAEGLDLTSATAKIGDFDAAKAASRAQTPVQTPHFMAPEVAARQAGPEVAAQIGEDYGPAADIWALGCVVFEMLELGLPYGEDLTLPQLEAALIGGEGPALSDRAAAESRAKRAVEIMDRCLKKEPSARPTAEEVMSWLEAGPESRDAMTQEAT